MEILKNGGKPEHRLPTSNWKHVYARLELPPLRIGAIDRTIEKSRVCK